MDRTIRASSSMIDKQIGKLWDLYNDKTAELHIQPQIVSVILAVPSLPGNILAMFRPEDKAITIIEDVLISNPEDMENIFLHELAHALDWYLYKASGHGQTFRECCRMLGALPEFSRSHVRLSIDKQNSRRETIKKLMALSSSPFENESASAIRKARKLMAESGLDGCAHEKIYMTALHSAGKFSYGTKMLLSYVEKASGVFIVTTHEGKERKAIAYGSLEEVEFSLYLFDYLSSSADREIRTRRKQGEHISKDNFMMGMIETLSSSTSESALDTSIIAIHDKNRDKAKRMIYPNTRLVTRSSRSSASFDDGSYGIGKCFGDNLEVPKAITRKAIR